MTPLQVKNYVLTKLHITAEEFYENHTDIETVANMVLDDIFGSISWKNLGYFGEYSVVNTTGSVRIYPIPATLLNKIVSIEVDTGNATVSWKPLIMKTKNDIPNFVFNETWITGRYNNENPHGFIHGGNLYILSGTVSANSPGIRFWYVDFPDKIASMDSTIELSIIKTVNTPTGGTTAVGLPRQFHRLFANGIIIDYKEANELPLVGREQLFDQDLSKKLMELSPLSTDEEIIADIPSNDGSEY